MRLRLQGLLLFPLLVGAIVLSVRADGPLFDPDEARFARTSLEMRRSGDWVVPQFEGEPRLVKPPLVHWLQATAFGLVGPGSRSARLHALAATLVVAWIVGQTARRRFGGNAGVWSAWIWLTTLLAFALGRLGTLDALLAAHVAALVALDLHPGPIRGRPWLAGALAGLATLVKGPVGPALALVITAAGRAASGRPIWPGTVAALKTLGAMLATLLPWLIPFLSRVGSGQFGETLRREVFDRSVSGTDHVEPIWYYAAVFGAVSLPWSAMAVVACVRALGPGGKARLGTTARYAAAGLIAGLVLLSASRGKRVTYLLPLLPLVSGLVTAELGSQLKAAAGTARTWAMTGAAAAFGILLGVLAVDRTDPAERTTAWIGAVAFTLAALVHLAGPPRRRAARVAGATIAASIVFQLAAGTVLLPRLAERRSSAGLVEAVPALRREPVVVVEMRVPSLTWYLDRVPERIDGWALPDRAARSDRPLFVFDADDLVGDLGAVVSDWQRVGAAGKYVVLREAPIPR